MPMLVPASSAMARSDAPSTPCWRKRRRAACKIRGSILLLGRAISGDLFREACRSDQHQKAKDADEPYKLHRGVPKPAPLERNAPHDAQKMRERQYLGEPLSG